MLFTLECDTNPYNSSWDYNTVKVLWSPSEDYYSSNNYIYNIELKKQINHADSLSFTITKNHPNYNLFIPQSALGISVALREVKIESAGNRFYFFGRCVSIDPKGLGQITVTCEGAMAFLNDILLRPVTFVTDEKPTKNWGEYLTYVLNKFHTRMVDKNHCYKRNIDRGLVSTLVNVRNAQSVDVTINKMYTGVDDYTTVMDAMNELAGVDSRIMMYTESGVDFYGNVFTNLNITLHPTDQPSAVMALDKNVIDISPSGSAYDMYSAIIPLDKNKLCMDTAITTSKKEGHKTEMSNGYTAEDAIFTDINNIGYIEKVANLSEYELDPDGDPEKESERNAFTTRAREILAQSNNRAVTEYSVKMVDLALLSGVDREPFTAHTIVDNIYQSNDENYIGRTTSALDTLKWTANNQRTIDIDGIETSVNPGDKVLYGYKIYILVQTVDDQENIIYVWQPSENAVYIPITTSPINLDPSRNPIIIDFDNYMASEGDKVVYGDYVYVWREVEHGVHEWDVYTEARYLNKKIGPNGGQYYAYCSGKNFIDIGMRVHFTCPEYGIYDDYYSPWVCTSLSMSLDNQAASSYTFAKIDSTYIPADDVTLSDLAKAILSNGRKTKDAASSGTKYMSQVQPTNVIKIDDNHVVEMYSDREVHYVADGEGDVRTKIRSYEMPVGTTDPDDPWPEPNNGN